MMRHAEIRGKGLRPFAPALKAGIVKIRIDAARCDSIGLEGIGSDRLSSEARGFGSLLLLSKAGCDLI